MTLFIADRPWYEQLAAALITLDWLAFGAMHFLNPTMVEKQVPDCLPAKKALVISTGFMEVALAIGLWTSFRPLAFLGTTVLLLLYVPAVLQICRSAEATAPFAKLFRTSPAGARAFIIVHNVIMASIGIAFWLMRT